MGIEAIRTAGATYQATSAPEIKSEVSQTKEQNISNQTGAMQIAENTVNLDTKEASDYQGSNQQSQKRNKTENVKNAVDQINKRAVNSEAVFGIHEGTNRVMIKIVDKTTKEVIKEFPPEKTLDMIEKAWELAGIMVDEKR